MSSLGIFDKETKTYKKVADLSKTAVADSSMSDTSTNAVQNKVVKNYIDGRTTFDSSMSDTSTNAVQNKVVKNYIDNGVNSAKKLQTYRYNSTTETYGNDYPIYAQWSSDGSHVKMKCDNYTVETDYATFANNASTVNGHTVNSDVPSGAKFTDTTYNDATTSAHGLMTPAMVSKLNGIADGANRTTVDTAMSDTSTNPVQNKVVKSYVDGTQTGYYVGSNPPTNKNILWIDSLHGGMIKYYALGASTWHPVRAKGYDTPVDLINEGYWNTSLGPGITIGTVSAIYDINTDKVTISIDKLNVTSIAPIGPNGMVKIIMSMYNVGHTGVIAAVSSSGPHPLEMNLQYPFGYIQLEGGAPYGTYKPASYNYIKFEFSHPSI